MVKPVVFLRGGFLSGDDWFLLIGGAIISIGWWFIGPRQSTLRINAQTLKRRRVYKQDISFSWNEVGKLTNGGSWIFVDFRNAIDGIKRTGVMADGLANSVEINRAIIEAAYRANPNVKIDPELIRRYGPPPYGIFTPPEKPQTSS